MPQDQAHAARAGDIYRGIIAQHALASAHVQEQHRSLQRLLLQLHAACQWTSISCGQSTLEVCQHRNTKSIPMIANWSNPKGIP